MRRATSLLLTLGLVALLGCNAALGAENPLAGTRWKLVAIGDTPAIEGVAVTLEFREGGRAGGSGGCNGYGGQYEVTGDRLAFKELASTLMACADDAATAQESRFLRALETASTFETAGDALTIACKGGALLKFVRQ